jgi:hypothetical protein
LWRRTGACLDAWASCGASEAVLSWLRDGYRLPWAAGGPPAPFHQGASLAGLQPDERAWLLPELQRCLLTGALEPGESNRWVTKAFLVPKAGQPGKWRLVVDLRHVNSHLLELVCRYETLKGVRGMIQRGDYLFSLDLADGYHCVPIHPADRKYLTFEVAGVGLFQCAALPFGLSASPFVFTKTMRAFVTGLRSPLQALETYEARQGAAAASAAYVPPHARRARGPTLRSLLAEHGAAMAAGVPTLPYMDDFACSQPTLELALRARSYVDALLTLLGLARNTKKGCWEPTQRLEHLGLGVDTLAMVFFLPEKRRDKIAAASRAMLALANARRNLVPKRRLAGVAGLVASAILAVPLARHHLRGIHDALAAEPRWDRSVRLTPEAREGLAWLARIPPRHLSRPMDAPAATAEVWTDASLHGWGAVLQVEGLRMEARGRWSAAEALEHINVLEMRAKDLAAMSFAPQIRGRHVHFWGDNLVVTYVAGSGTSRSPELMRATRSLFRTLDLLTVSTTESWLSTTDNAAADRLSRAEDVGGLVLSPWLSRRLLAAEPHSCDRFATAENALLARFNSAHAHPLSSGVDAFSQADWAAGRSWCHPPIALLPRLALLLRESRAAATVVAPDWPAQAWYQALRSLATRWERVPAYRRPFASPEAAAWGAIVFHVH